MKDPWRDPKGDPFGEEGSGALDDSWPLSPAVMPVGTAGTRIALSLTEPRGPDTCTTLRCDNERQRPGVGFWWQASEESNSSETGEGVRKRIGGRKCCSEWLEPLKSWCFWQIIRPGNENALWLALRSQIASQLYQHWALPVILVMPSVGTVVVLLFQDKEISPDPGLEFFLVWSPGLWSGIHFWTTLTCNSPLETQDSDLICETTPTFYSIIVVFIIFISCGCLPCTFWLDVVYFLHLKGPLKIVGDVDHAVFFVK